MNSGSNVMLVQGAVALGNGAFGVALVRNCEQVGR